MPLLFPARPPRTVGALILLLFLPALAAAAITPGSLEFGNVLIGQGDTRSATLTNNGDGPITISLINFSVGGTAFTRLAGGRDDCDIDQTLQASDSCVLRVEFSPTTVGLQTNSLVAVANGVPRILNLSGTGVQPVLSIDPLGPVSFPPTAVGANSAAQSFTVSNSGTPGASLQLAGISLTGAHGGDFQVSGGSCVPGATLGGGETCSLQLRFEPSAIGPRTAALELAASFGDVPLAGRTVELSGLGQAAPVISLNPAEQLVASLRQGQSVRLPLQIANLGQAPLVWNLRDGVGGPTVLLRASRPLDVPRVDFAAPQGSARGMREAQADDGERADPEVRGLTGTMPIGGDLIEDFDDISLLPGRGWDLVNRSVPLGPMSWFQGNEEVFPAQSGAANSYIAANFQSTTSPGTPGGTISNWLLSPEVALINGTTIRFRTRARQGSVFPDRLEVRLSLSGASGNVGNSATSVGDFSVLLESINPGLVVGGYPVDWAGAGEVAIVIDGLPQASTGRIGLRYFVPDAGPLGSNSDYIGIDSFRVEQPGCAGPTARWNWIDIAPSSGSIAGGQQSVAQLTLDSRDLDFGAYVARLCVGSNDPQAPLRELDIDFTIIEASIFRDGFEGIDDEIFSSGFEGTR